MPLPKGLRGAKRAASVPQGRSKCVRCNNLDPRGHPSSTYQSESSKTTLASLTIVIDTIRLANNRTSSNGKPTCRYCEVLAHALDAFFQGWRTFRGRALVDIKEKGRIRVSIDKESWKFEQVEIFAGSGKMVPLASPAY